MATKLARLRPAFHTTPPVAILALDKALRTSPRSATQANKRGRSLEPRIDLQRPFPVTSGGEAGSQNSWNCGLFEKAFVLSAQSSAAIPRCPVDRMADASAPQTLGTRQASSPG